MTRQHFMLRHAMMMNSVLHVNDLWRTAKSLNLRGFRVCRGPLVERSSGPWFWAWSDKTTQT